MEVVVPGTEESKRFPFIDLEKAVDRAKALFDADNRGQEMPVSTAFELWGYSTKSSGGYQTVAALKSYGLTEAPDSGKIKLTTGARTYFLEERDEERSELLRQFALSPSIFASLWDGPWGDNPPSDTVARSHLKVDRGFNDQSSRALLGIYKNNVAFSGLKGYAPLAKGHQEGRGGGKSASELVTEGQYVQWTSNEVDQFRSPRRVVWVSEDGTHLRVHGSNTGIPMEEVTVEKRPTNRADTVLPPPNSGEGRRGTDDFSVLLSGNQLEITATVDAEGLARLMQVLTKYEEILQLLE